MAHQVKRGGGKLKAHRVRFASRHRPAQRPEPHIRRTNLFQPRRSHGCADAVVVDKDDAGAPGCHMGVSFLHKLAAGRRVCTAAGLRGKRILREISGIREQYATLAALNSGNPIGQKFKASHLAHRGGTAIEPGGIAHRRFKTFFVEDMQPGRAIEPADLHALHFA